MIEIKLYLLTSLLCFYGLMQEEKFINFNRLEDLKPYDWFFITLISVVPLGFIVPLCIFFPKLWNFLVKERSWKND